MAASERVLGCVMVALLGGCSLITSASDHQDGTGMDAGPPDAFVAADGGDGDDMGGADMGSPPDLGSPEDLGSMDLGTEVCSGVADLSGGSLTAEGRPAYDVGSFTLEVWFRPSAAALMGDRNVFGRWGEFGMTGSYALYLSEGRPSLGLSCTGMDFYAASAPGTLTAGAWVHLAATFEASTGRMRVFVDGTSVVSIDANDLGAPDPCPPFPLTSTANLVLGYDDPRGGDPAQGLVDEARLSDTVRYPDEFTPATTFTADGNTIALYQFEDASLPAADSGATGNPMSGEGSVALTTACRPIP